MADYEDVIDEWGEQYDDDPDDEDCIPEFDAQDREDLYEEYYSRDFDER